MRAAQQAGLVTRPRSAADLLAAARHSGAGDEPRTDELQILGMRVR